MAWLPGWGKRIEIGIDHTKVDAALSDFPVLIHLSAASGYASADVTAVFDELTSDANRKKIAVTTSDGSTECYVEIERWDDANEAAWLWVKVPSVSHSAATILYLYYDSAHADNTANVGDIGSTSGKAVWDGDFTAVYHGSAQGVDSTASGYDLTGYGSPGSGDPLTGFDLDGEDAFYYIESPASGLKPAQITTEAVVYFHDISTTGVKRPYAISEQPKAAWADGRGYVLILQPTSGKPMCMIGDASGSWKYALGGTALSINTQGYIEGRFNGLQIKTSLNGGTVATETFAGSISYADRATGGPNPQTFYIGAGHDADDSSPTTLSDMYFSDGLLGEIRISKAVRSDAWIKATYNSNFDLLLDFGAEERTIFPAVAEITFSALVPFILPVLAPSAEIRFSSFDPTLVGLSIDIAVPAPKPFLFSPETPRLSYGYPVPLKSAILWSALAPSLFIGERIPGSKLRSVYIFTLTGAPDGTTDIEIPIKSFQGRIRQGTPTYLSAVIPGMDYAAAISARANGEMSVELVQYYRGIVYRRNEIARVTLENIVIDEGPASQSITLIGHKTETFTAKSVALFSPVYYGLSNGKKRYRFAAPDLDLRPGDTVTVGSDSFTAGMLSYTISPGRNTMDVSEAED